MKKSRYCESISLSSSTFQPNRIKMSQLHEQQIIVYGYCREINRKYQIEFILKMICSYVRDNDCFLEDIWNWKHMKYLNHEKIVINESNKSLYHQGSSNTNQAVFGPSTYKWTFKIHKANNGIFEFGIVGGFISPICQLTKALSWAPSTQKVKIKYIAQGNVICDSDVNPIYDVNPINIKTNDIITIKIVTNDKVGSLYFGYNDKEYGAAFKNLEMYPEYDPSLCLAWRAYVLTTSKGQCVEMATFECKSTKRSFFDITKHDFEFYS